MWKIFVLLFVCSLTVASCDSVEKYDTAKMAMTMKMKKKVKRVSAELKAYCDSETYRQARFKADSILLKRGSNKWK